MPFVVPDPVHEPLYCIVPLFDPFRHKTRWKHTERTVKHLVDSGAVVVLVEAAYNHREFAFANSGLDGTPASCGVLGSDHRFRHKYIGLRTKDELWLKENMVNLAVAHLPYDAQYIAWTDGDIHFLRPNWVGECIHKLQHYSFVQMFSHARDLDPEYELLPEDYPHAAGLGFVHYHAQQAFGAHVAGMIPHIASKDDGELAVDLNDPVPLKYHPHPPHPPHPHPHSPQPPAPPPVPRLWPGLAWACTRQAFDAVGGLLDFAVWGGSDWHIAHCLLGKTELMMRTDLHPNYQKMVMEWFNRCERHIRRNVGVMRGSIAHYWHGRKVQRGYNPKHRLLAQAAFDPLRHLKRDYQGLWQLNDDGSDSFLLLRDAMRDISRSRNEDTNDTRIDLSNELWWRQ